MRTRAKRQHSRVATHQIDALVHRMEVIAAVAISALSERILERESEFATAVKREAAAIEVALAGAKTRL